MRTSSIDKFISHTWKTKGQWKFLSLLLHFGWPIVLTCWACGVAIAFSLCMLDVLPLFNVWEVHALGYDGVIPSGCWIQLFGFLSVILGCLIFPHVPHGSDQCFLDFSCIHQTESTKTLTSPIVELETLSASLFRRNGIRFRV